MNCGSTSCTKVTSVLKFFPLLALFTMINIVMTMIMLGERVPCACKSKTVG